MVKFLGPETDFLSKIWKVELGLVSLLLKAVLKHRETKFKIFNIKNLQNMVHAFCFPHQSIYHYSVTWTWHFNNILFVVSLTTILLRSFTYVTFFCTWGILLSFVLQEYLLVSSMLNCVPICISIVFNKYLCNGNDSILSKPLACMTCHLLWTCWEKWHFVFYSIDNILRLKNDAILGRCNNIGKSQRQEWWGKHHFH